MINIQNVSKSFKDNLVIDALNLQIDDGEITALVGKNGAGKSTLIRMICGLLKPEQGTISIGSKSEVGVLLGGDISLYKNLTAYEIIKFFGKLNGLEQIQIDKRIDELDKILDFKSFINNKAYTFSRGMRQKIGLAISIIHNPDVLLLDEPSTGLDLEASNDVIDFIKYLKQQNKTILIATHNIFEISDLSDNIAILNDGKIQGKINTKKFFEKCPSDEKNAHIIDLMKGNI